MLPSRYRVGTTIAVVCVAGFGYFTDFIMIMTRSWYVRVCLYPSVCSTVRMLMLNAYMCSLDMLNTLNMNSMSSSMAIINIDGYFVI